MKYLVTVEEIILVKLESQFFSLNHQPLIKYCNYSFVQYCHAP